MKHTEASNSLTKSNRGEQAKPRVSSEVASDVDSRSKDRGTYTNQCRTLFNSHGEVMTHPHRKFFHGNAAYLLTFDAPGQLTQPNEVRSRLFSVFGIGRDGHQTPDFQVWETRDITCKIESFFLRNPRFTRLHSDVDLN